ncbi:MAG: DUF3108 domain-containing protein [Bacteroidota bacterium]
MRRTDKGLLAAIGLSVALHFALLFGTPPRDHAWHYQAPEPLELTIVAAAPVAVAPEPVRRPVKKKAAPAAGAVRPSAPPPVPTPGPAPIAAPSLLEAPSPDGEPVALAEAGTDTAPATIEAAATPAADPGAESKPAAEYPLKHARLVYDLYYATLNSGNEATRVGELTHTWSQDGEHYQAEAVAEASGLVAVFFDGKFVQRSTGQLGAGGLVPAEYTLDRGRGGRVERARFDWAARKLALEWKDEARTVELPVGAQDPLSLLHQLYFLQPVPAAASLSVVTSRKIGQYVYQLAGEEPLATPLGTVHALRFRRHEEGGNRIDVWLDRDRNLLPARIYAVDRKGNVLDQVIREARFELAEQRPEGAAR